MHTAKVHGSTKAILNLMLHLTKITDKSFMWDINTEKVKPKETLKSSDEMRNRIEFSF